MSIIVTTDITGFPLVHLLDLGLAVHLWPIAHTQFTACLEDRQDLLTSYVAACAVQPPSASNPRPSGLENRIMTGVVPEDLIAFAEWMNDRRRPENEDGRYAIPNVEQWRAVHEYLQYERFDPHQEAISGVCSNPIVQDFFQLVLRERQLHTLLDLSLMREGVIEWVRDENRWTGLGQPTWDFFPNTFEPMRETIDPIDSTRRQRTFGFRLIRDL